MKVWIVEECIPYEGCTVLGVFATKAAAEAYIGQKCFLVWDGDWYQLVEWEVTP